MTRMSQSRFLQGARTLVENAAGMPELSGVLEGYGYTEAKLKEGIALVEEADRLAKRKDAEYGEQYEASSALSRAWSSATVVYSKTLKLARIALGDDAKGVTALRLMGARKQSLAGWYEQAGTFYENILKEPRFVSRMEGFGYTKDKLKTEKTVVDGVMKKFRAREGELGQALASTTARDRKLKDLDAWVSTLRAVCEVAFYDQPEELEKLGPLAPTRKRKASPKKKAVSAEA
ncbi:MAG: hypothetical protein KKA67_04995 [Spirochaetes bacterium]|nr:hypothetical protein [Spirochaetota bacterium]MBU1081689.1 hypothetical protein [Spirochaetota bacterium]